MTNIYWDEPQLSDGDMPNNRKTIGLINYEGDVLKLYKVHTNEFVIYDQWDSIVEILKLKDLCEWLEGKSTLVDSNGKQWIYTDHKDACQSLYNIMKYIIR
jgi:hypothetical protein